MFHRRPILANDDMSNLVAKATTLQQELRSKVSLENDFRELRTIAGIDVSHSLDDMSYAAIVLLNIKTLQPIASVRAEMPTDFPYIPGFLSFREIPLILKALDELPQRPDMLMVDGQGIAHPRRLGIAAHLGVVTNLPAIGVAKSRLTGRYKELGDEKGETSDLIDKGEKIGTVLRSKIGCLPLFVSSGHRVDQDTALSLTLCMLTRYRLPEPTRLADKLSKTRDKKAE
jgi:deoxyribonuclease V